MLKPPRHSACPNAPSKITGPTPAPGSSAKSSPNASPSSSVNLLKAWICWGFAASVAVFLHYILHGFRSGRKVESESGEQFGHWPIRTRHHPQAHFMGVRTLHLFDRQYHVQAAHGGHFLEQLAGAVAQPLAGHPHFQGAP